MDGSVRLSVCHTFLTIFLSSYHHEIFRSDYHWQEWCSCKRSRSEVKVTHVKTQFSCCRTVLQFEFTYGNEMKHKAWCGIEEVPYCFSRSSVKFQGHMAQKIVDFDPQWGVGGAVWFLVVGTIGQEERPPRGQLWMEQCLTSLKYWPI